MDSATTVAVVNDDVAPTSLFVTRRDAVPDPAALIARVAGAIDAQRIYGVAATSVVEQIVGDAIGVNLFLVGFAWQRGLIPVSRQAIKKAIALNGVAIELNNAAFEWGRVAAHNPAEIVQALRDIGGGMSAPAPLTLDQLVAHRAAFLTQYQNAGYAARYVALVDMARTAEARIKPERCRLSEAVARQFFRLMAYKDEYEVARLFTDGTFDAALRRQFEGDLKVSYHLAPPLFARIDPSTGRPRKTKFGPWARVIFRLLASMKILRGTSLDPFGRSAERRKERELRDEYEATFRRHLPELGTSNYDTILALAELPGEMRGFGPVKAKAIEACEEKRRDLLSMLNTPPRSLAA